MPSSKNYKRDYKREYELQKKRGDVGGSDSPNSKRKRARTAFVSKHGMMAAKGKDIDHKKALSKGGSNAPSNVRAVPASQNRSFKRNADSSMK